MKHAMIFAGYWLLAGTLAYSTPVTLQVDQNVIREGESVTCTISREQTEGDLEVKYVVDMPIIPVVAVTASSEWARNGALLAIDGRLDTSWSSRGNSKSDGTDDNPSITFLFAEASPIGAMKVANYVVPYHTFRGAKTVLVETSADGIAFSPLATQQLRRGTENSKVGVFETFPLGGVRALAVRLTVLSNYDGREFGNGSSFENAHSNRSIAGLMEVEFSRPGATAMDVQALPGKIRIPHGERSVSFPVRSIDDQWIEGDEVLQLRLLHDESYTLAEPFSATVTILDNDFGDLVSIAATEPVAREEGETAGQFTISRTGTTGELVVRYATSTQPVPIIAASASSSRNASPARNAHDGSLETTWINTGNAKYESEKDDEPWIIFTFDQVYVIGQMRVANYRQRDHQFRGVQEMEVLVATDMVNFSSLGSRTLPVTPNTAPLPEYVLLDLGGVEARRVMLRILSNHANRQFWQGTSYEDKHPNVSFVALSEVQFLTGSSAGRDDLKEPLSGTITIPDGQQRVTLPILPRDDQRAEGDETITLTLIPDYLSYTVSEHSAATVTIVDNE